MIDIHIPLLRHCRVLLFLLILTAVAPLTAQVTTSFSVSEFSFGNTGANTLPPTSPPLRKNTSAFDVDDIFNIFSGSEIFVPGSDFIWGSYAILSNYGLRPDRIRTIIPPLGLHYEYSLFGNFGVRLDLGANHWEEEKVLAQFNDTKFTEIFEYRYWTLGVAATYHFNTGLDWDPYIGYAFTYRRGRAFCDCVDETLEVNSQDFFGGIRYFATNSLFLQAEVGATGVGVLEVGLGFQFY